MGEPPPLKPYHILKDTTMKRTDTTKLETAVWEHFNAHVLSAAAVHLPHDVDAYERARDIAQRKAEREVDNIRAAARDADERERARRWRQPSALVPFDSELS